MRIRLYTGSKVLYGCRTVSAGYYDRIYTGQKVRTMCGVMLVQALPLTETFNGLSSNSVRCAYLCCSPLKRKWVVLMLFCFRLGIVIGCHLWCLWKRREGGDGEGGKSNRTSSPAVIKSMMKFRGKMPSSCCNWRRAGRAV